MPKMTCNFHNEISNSETFSTLGGDVTFAAQKVDNIFQFRGIQGPGVVDTPTSVVISADPPVALPPLPNIGYNATTEVVQYGFDIPAPQFEDEFPLTYSGVSYNTGILVGNDVVIATPGYYRITATVRYRTFVGTSINGYMIYRLRNVADDILLEWYNTNDDGEDEDKGVGISITLFLQADTYRFTFQALNFGAEFNFLTMLTNYLNVQLVAL